MVDLSRITAGLKGAASSDACDMRIWKGRLDTMLVKEKGIVSSSSTYPEGIATIGFDPEQTTEQAIKEFIASLGFSVDDERKVVARPNGIAKHS